jgi:glycerol-1-phosphate dehydrogenase [NAD(P)+]
MVIALGLRSNMRTEPMNTLAPASAQLNRLLADNLASGKPGTTRHVALGEGAIAAAPHYFKEAFPGRDVLLLCDDHTLAAAGHAVESALQTAGLAVRRVVLEPRPGDDHLVAEDGVITSVQTLLGSLNAAVVTVGAGTVNDIGKYASFKLGREYLCVPTAASMNGYTSTIAAVLVGGVKRTLPCDQPAAIFADTKVLQAAPSHLNLAGFGDLLSKPVSQGDWLLSHFLRDVPYATRPNDILEELFRDLLREASAIGRADAHGLQVLMEAILVSGFSMAVAGSSAPASGGEHLVSHYWDMEQLDRNAPLLGLHGTQVGVATRLSAMLFERLLAFDPATLDEARIDALVHQRGEKDAMLAALPAVHGGLRADVVKEVAIQLERKQRFGDALRKELTLVRERWPEIHARIASVMLPVATIEQALTEAGCPDRPSQIGCDRDRAIHTLRVCRQIRDRYCALDLIDDLGLLEAWAAEAVDRAEA